MKQRELECLDKAIYPTPARKSNIKRIACYTLFGAAIALVPLQAWADSRFIPQIIVSSTIPATGDLSPYGIAFVPPGFPAGGLLKPGDVLVSNFNNSSNLQGTGTTIIQLTPTSGAAPDMQASVFFQGTPPLGFTLALGVLTRGFVIAGNVTTTDGTSGTVAAGPLLFIDQNGKLVKSFTTSLDGPWGLALVDGFDHAKVFVSNVLDGTVTRIDLSLPDSETVNVTGTTQIASRPLRRRLQQLYSYLQFPQVRDIKYPHRHWFPKPHTPICQEMQYATSKPKQTGTPMITPNTTQSIFFRVRARDSRPSIQGGSNIAVPRSCVSRRKPSSIMVGCTEGERRGSELAPFCV